VIADQVLNWGHRRGYQVSWAPAAALEEVRIELAGRLAAEEIDADFASECLSSFDFSPAMSLRWTVVLIAMPRPAHRVGFTVKGQRVDAVVPPTYVRYRGTFADVGADLAAHALPSSRVEILNAPLKPLAARLGLARYGRNNLCYVPPFGSYMQLLGYLTDADLRVRADWQPCEPALLDLCDDCNVCEAVCPTGAIADDRVLLHAERCLTFANENRAPIPAWVPPGAHHTLIGCLQCQRHCPANGALPIEDSGILFTEEETAALLDGSTFGPDSPEAREKLDRLALTEKHLIGRNLKALLNGGRR
jgi:epoxyqueuosine reductase